MVFASSRNDRDRVAPRGQVPHAGDRGGAAWRRETVLSSLCQLAALNPVGIRASLRILVGIRGSVAILPEEGAVVWDRLEHGTK